MGSPVVLGKRGDDHFVCSDANAIADWVDEIIYLEEGERALLRRGEEPVIWSENGSVRKTPHPIDQIPLPASREGHPHFMLKEIMEQPDVLRDMMRGRLLADEGRVQFGGLEDVRERLQKTNRLTIVACGTAFYAGCVGKYLLERYGGIPIDVEPASEFRYRYPVMRPGMAVLAISQSGETADTLAAIRVAKKHGVLALGLVNVPGSAIARETDAGIFTRAGVEIGVASTKTFLAQITALSMLTLFFGRDRNLDQMEAIRIARELEQIPSKLERILAQRTAIASLAQKYQWMQNVFFWDAHATCQLPAKAHLNSKKSV